MQCNDPPTIHARTHTHTHTHTHTQSLLSQLETLRLPTPALVHTFMSELAEKQQVEVERGNKKLGTLLLTVGYLREKRVVEVSIIQAQHLPGLDKSGEEGGHAL